MSLEVSIEVETKVSVEFDRDPTQQELNALLDSIIGQMSENQVRDWLNSTGWTSTLGAAFKRSHLS